MNDQPRISCQLPSVPIGDEESERLRLSKPSREPGLKNGRMTRRTSGTIVQMPSTVAKEAPSRMPSQHGMNITSSRTTPTTKTSTGTTEPNLLLIVPLVLLVILPFFKPGSLNGFDNLSLSLSSSPIGTKGSWQLILGWSFIYTWTVLAMEAAACYIGECREPVRDAKIAITAEGLFGFFIYVTLPIMVFTVLGTVGLQQLAKDNEGWIGDANILFQGYVDQIFGVNQFWTWFIGLSLIVALSLSVLNAIMGASRGLYQNSHDGILPKAFGWANKHKAPSFAMLVSLGCSIAVLTVGSPLQIYVFSNMGYLFALAVSMVGYGVFRATREDTARDLRMPRAFGPLALIVGVAGLLLWAIGGYYAADYVVGEGYRWLYWIGLILLALYFPLYWWRTIEDKSAGGSAEAAAPSSGGSA